MLRSMLAVVPAYLLMAIFIMVALSTAWMVLGPRFAFKEGTTEVIGSWIAINLPLSFMGAVIGGLTAMAVGRTAGPVRVLAILILALGFVMAGST